jgi:hypothetical protein
VFKLNAQDGQRRNTPAAAAVRAHPPKISNFKGQEKRAEGVPKGAAARTPSKPATLPAPAPKSAAQQASGSGEGEWESF